ncbi:hypothetical protein ABT264_19335 [Streptomyces virginiae]|uniref:hypothetical protein n=1 Tax=Streptomyces virginiae TaxID=1961 RepID=UPI003324B7BF
MSESVLHPGGPWTAVGPVELRTVLSDPLGTIRVRLAPPVDGRPDPVRTLVAASWDDFAAQMDAAQWGAQNYDEQAYYARARDSAQETACAVRRGRLSG